MIYKNILKGGWRLPQILNDTYLGKGSKLTPPNPQFPKDVLKALEHMGFAVEIQTGIRVFHDYLSDEAKTITDHHELFELEYRYCRMPVFRDMGRYVHVLAQRR
jgi:S-adenosylmethionine-dependent methyltransferase